MTQEQYNRAVLIDMHIRALEEIKKYGYHLTYMNEVGREVPDWVKPYISKILETHNHNIMSEVKSKIQELKEEVERL